MVDVGAKPVTARTAVAAGVVVCSERARELLRTGSLPKGDGLAVARVAGIMAAKRTSELIPLCHPLPLDAVSVELIVDDVVTIEARVEIHGRTGAEMEALTAVAVAGLTVIDMIKAIDRGASLRSVRVVAKSGGASGAWADGQREATAALPAAGVVTVSDRVSAGEREDVSGPLLAAGLARAGASVGGVRVVPDEADAIRDAVSDLVASGCGIVVTTGGTGLSPRDVTPEALAPLLTRTVPGLAEGLRAAGAAHAAGAALSRGVAGVIERDGRAVFVVALPGSSAAVADAMAYLGPLLPHIVDQLGGGDHSASAVERVESPETRDDPRVERADVGAGVIDLAALEASVRRPGAGAVVTFGGIVRDHDDGRAVTALDYEAHPDASAWLRRVATDVLDDHPGVACLAVAHRTGTLVVGEVAFGAVVASPHRAEAFAACADLVDRVKAGVPIWKRQQFTDGTGEWVGL